MARPPVLIVARSARMLAAAAAPTFAPWTIDFFADADLRGDSVGWRRLAPGARLRFPVSDLTAAVAQVQHAAGPMPLVLGSGFERQPELVTALCARWQVAGAGADVYKRLLDIPAVFAALAASGKVQLPATSRTRGSEDRPWLSKRNGGTGGFHVRRARRGRATAPRGRYFQALQQGLSVSAVCLGNGADARVTDTFVHLAWRPGKGNRYAYQGAMTWVPPALAAAEAIADAASCVARELAMRGVFGLDFIAAPDGGVWLVDINPRPPATFDLCREPGRLFARHLREGLAPEAGFDAAVNAAPRSPARARRNEYRGHLVIYADAPWRVPANMPWPAQTADRPLAGEDVAQGAPVCTLRARADTPEEVRALLAQRYAALARVTNRDGGGVLPAEITISTVGGDHNE